MRQSVISYQCQSEKFCKHIISIKHFPFRFLLLFQILTSVPTKHTTVVMMLYVTTPGDPITVLAKMDFMEMEKNAEVTICDTVWFEFTKSG